MERIAGRCACERGTLTNALTVNSVRSLKRCQSNHEAEVVGWETGKVRKDGIEIALIDAEPACQRRRILIAGGRRDHLATLQTVRAIEGEIGKDAAACRRCSVDAPPAYRPAHDELIAGPRVIGAVAIGI